MFSCSRLSFTKHLFRMIPVVLGILVFPVDAFAWGPAAHIDFSMQILAGAVSILPSISGMLLRRRVDFLYGSLAADSVMGKNMACDLTHCHSWSVARELLDQARQKGERYEAFMLGYIGHLAADVVAHNRFVPDRLVACYRIRGTGHLYWEARFDQKIVGEQPEIRAIWQDLVVTKFPEYDRFLAKRIKPTLFSHRLSVYLYRRSLAVQHRKPWQSMVGRLDSHSRASLSVREMDHASLPSRIWIN